MGDVDGKNWLFTIAVALFTHTCYLHRDVILMAHIVFLFALCCLYDN